MIIRTLESQVKNSLFSGEVIVLYGPRRVGKTTLVKKLVQEYNGMYLDCELDPINTRLKEMSSLDQMKAFIEDKTFIVLDEAQVISGIGQKLKSLVDHFPEVQILATGSSSFELSHQVGEPLVGRARWFHMYPLSIREIRGNEPAFMLQSKLETLLIYGAMPSVYTEESLAEKEQLLYRLSSGLLYKDILAFEDVRKATKIKDLLKALALQVGSEVSYSEIGDLINVDLRTVERYIDLLEKSFVIKVIRPLYTNPRTELKKKVKVYFYDLGLRNALIQNFNPLDIRQDKGALWENFCFLEFMKKKYESDFHNLYFWRNRRQQEVDMVEMKNGKYYAYECKFNPRKTAKLPKAFIDTYPEHEFAVINSENFYTYFIED